MARTSRSRSPARATVKSSAPAPSAPAHSASMWSASSSGVSMGLFPSWMRSTIGPLLLIAVTLPFPPLIAHACADPVIAGSARALVAAALASPFTLVSSALRVPTRSALAALAAHSGWQLALMRLLPGRAYSGPVTAAGETPRYVDNGVLSFVCTVVAFFGLSTWGLGALLPPALHFSPTVFFHEYAAMLSILPIAALVMCLALYIKGLTCPSSRDSGSSGNVVVDLFWGTELYPRCWGFDVKQFTNCRHALMLWPLIPLSFAAHLFELGALSNAMIVNVALQVIYCFKFFVWEAGYMASMDIAHDRAGYYLCWGCAAFVPSMYVVHSWWLVTATVRALAAGTPPPELSPGAAAAALVLGLASIALNYDADRQRQEFRAAPKEKIWGAAPRFVRAPYVTEAGEKRESLLLSSGWWGLARHWHYVPEWLAALAWTLPAGASSALPYAYVAFLAILLLDRAHRDDARCEAKYGAAWVKYRAAVPWRIVPGIY